MSEQPVRLVTADEELPLYEAELDYEAWQLSTGPGADASIEQGVSLCEVLDRVLTKGVVLKGDVVISVANVDLLYLGVQLLLCSAETAEGIGVWKRRRGLQVTPGGRAAAQLVPGGGS